MEQQMQDQIEGGLLSEKEMQDIANKVLKEEYHDFQANSWHYEREYRMLVKAMTLLRIKK